ncbi:MAG: hypothetical protein KDA45_04325 [Planctomycetales bacterium]|nr:hypothetical protein [Planctomycetales bacterium]
MCFAIVRGLVAGLLPNEILSQCLVIFLAFGAIGFWIGFWAEKTITESVENRFRSEMVRLHSATAESNSETSEH